MDIVLRALRRATIGGLLIGAIALAMASGVAGMTASNSDLNGAYHRENSSTLDCYWFDGQTRVVSSMWTPVSGTYLSEGSYEVSPGTLFIEYGDGSTEQFGMQIYNDGIELDEWWYEYVGEACP